MPPLSLKVLKYFIGSKDERYLSRLYEQKLKIKITVETILMKWWAISKKKICYFTVTYFLTITIHSFFIFLSYKK